MATGTKISATASGGVQSGKKAICKRNCLGNCLGRCTTHMKQQKTAICLISQGHPRPKVRCVFNLERDQSEHYAEQQKRAFEVSSSGLGDVLHKNLTCPKGLRGPQPLKVTNIPRFHPIQLQFYGMSAIYHSLWGRGSPPRNPFSGEPCFHRKTMHEDQWMIC